MFPTADTEFLDREYAASRHIPTALNQRISKDTSHHRALGRVLKAPFSRCYTGFSHRPTRLVAYASQGLLPHISHRSPSFLKVSLPGLPSRVSQSVEIGVTQPQTDAGTKCFEYIYTFLYDSFNCGTINYLKIIDGL